MRLHPKFIARQIGRSRKQAAVFVSCVALSIVSLIALSGFTLSVDRQMQADARRLHAGDIIIHSHQRFSPALEAALEGLLKRTDIQSARIYEFYSVVRSMAESASLLSHLKIVEPGYPFYGSIELRSGRDFSTTLVPGRIVVQQGVLDRLKLKVGDRLKIGDSLMTIADVVESEPDRPVDFFSLGPRIFISASDIQGLNLVQTGSRVRYKILLKTPLEEEADPIAAALKLAAVEDQEQVHTFRTAQSRAKRFLDNFLFFLSLIGSFTLLLAGIGIQSALSAFVKDKHKTIAIMKTLGATSRFVTIHFLVILSCLGVLGTSMGIIMAAGLQRFLPVLFAGLLPADITLSLSWTVAAQGAVLGVVVVAVFSFLPLQGLKEIRPGAIFRNEPGRSHRSGWGLLAAAGGGLFFVGMVLSRAGEVRIAVYFLTGAAVLIAASALIAGMLFKLLRHLKIRYLPLRQALKGLFRPRNATTSIVVTLCASLTIIFSIYLIETNLDATFVRSFPPDAPNLFFLDIQPSQKEAFSEAVGVPAVFYPVIRSRIVSIDGEKIDRQKELRRRGDNLARAFNLTYRDHLLEDEVIIAGEALFDKSRPDVQVSILDTVAKIHPLKIGDRIAFRIQGIPLSAVVSSIRRRTHEGMKPFFYFVFPENVLQDAPQTIFTAIRVPPGQIGALQNRMAAQFPNVSAVDVTQTVAALSKMMARLSAIVRFFTAFSILAGLLIIVSSVFATRIARTREAVYYKILGARSGFVLQVFIMENALLGIISSTLAVFFAQLVAWQTTTRLLDIGYKPFAVESMVAMAGASLLVTVVGLIPSATVLKVKPARFLRSQAQE